MKQTLLALSLLFFASLAFSQSLALNNEQPRQVKISVYPNPVTNFISINKDENVKSLAIFNLVGRKLKTFKDVEKDQRYDVSDLPNGMYLVQILDNNSKIITTQRVSKK